MLKFKKHYSNYQSESYQSDTLLWNKCEVVLRVSMEYHTFKKYWHVNYSCDYGTGLYTILIDGKSDIENRKQARKIAMEFMTKADISDIDKLSDFNKGCIKNF